MSRPDFLVIYRTDTMKVTSVVDPEYEWECDDPAWTKHDKVELRKFRMPRHGLKAEIAYENYGAVLARAQGILDWLRKSS